MTLQTPQQQIPQSSQSPLSESSSASSISASSQTSRKALEPVGITLAKAAQLLQTHGLLREIITPQGWTLTLGEQENAQLSAITYDSREIAAGTLLICKGNFKTEYLSHADEQGLGAYVAQCDYSAYTHAPGIIVNDARKAMSLLAAAFFQHPERQLTIVGITGTKGKTTTAYFTHAMLEQLSGQRAALFSSVDNCLDGRTFSESDLTTPESLDAFRMMREAVEHGMRYLVMEVSSQAYKVHRVYGLQFQVGAFLNISPDHISPLEHPTFEDYFYCKRQLIAHCEALVLAKAVDYHTLLLQEAQAHQVRTLSFALEREAEAHANASVDVVARKQAYGYSLSAQGAELGSLHLALAGDFNYANAAAAVAILEALGIKPTSEALQAMERVRIAGRMEQFQDAYSPTIALVDYAHNYLSVSSILDYVEQRFGDKQPFITLITGSAGDKAYDRRKEIVEAAQHRIARFIFTSEDTNTESTKDIAYEMQGFVTDEHVKSSVVLDRAQAIEQAVREARAASAENAASAASGQGEGRLHVILVIGKGNERWIKEHNRHVPYEGDDRVVERLFAAAGD